MFSRWSAKQGYAHKPIPHFTHLRVVRVSLPLEEHMRHRTLFPFNGQ